MNKQQSKNLISTPIGDRVIVKMWTKTKEKSSLVTLSGESVTEKYGTEFFNIFTVKAVSETCFSIKVGDIVSLQDEWLQDEPDFSAGLNPTTGEPKHYRPLGKLLPYFYSSEKGFTKFLDVNDVPEEKELLFLISPTIIAVRHDY